MKHIITLMAAAALACPLTAEADFFESGEYNGSMLTLGVRMGFNSANMAGDDYSKLQTLDSWGTGFDAGVVANLNIRDWIAIQPGFFFQSRSNDFSYTYDPAFYPDVHTGIYEQYGHRRHTMFKIPVMAVVRFHPADNIVWSLEAGPVFNYGLGGHEWWHSTNETGQPEHTEGYFNTFNRFMMGLKMGTGIEILDHYYLGIHYEAGLRSAMKWSMGGHDKCWSFCVGYNF